MICCEADVKKNGHDRNGHQRYYCRVCRKTRRDAGVRKVNTLKDEKLEAVIALLLEGHSIRSIERSTRVHRNTVMTVKNKLVERGILDAGTFTRNRKRNCN